MELALHFSTSDLQQSENTSTFVMSDTQSPLDLRLTGQQRFDGNVTKAFIGDLPVLQKTIQFSRNL